MSHKSLIKIYQLVFVSKKLIHDKQKVSLPFKLFQNKAAHKKIHGALSTTK